MRAQRATRPHQAGGLPGVSIAVVNRCSALHAAVGARRAGAPEQVTPQTSFGIGSISKALTAILAHQQIEDGLASFETTVAELAPTIDIDGSDSVTILDLLSHTSGVPAYLGWYADGNIPSGPLRSALQQPGFVERWSDPGDVHLYSNPAFALLGLAIENAAGIPFAELAERDVFEPLGIEASFVNRDARVL